MTEDFLHYIWRTRNFDFRNLRTTDGLAIEVLDFGHWNTGAGPDFLIARITLDGTEWAGNIEMHLSSSEWNRHGHSHDPAYESVILHVVLEEDVPVYISSRKLPCVELRNRIDHRMVGRYLRLIATESWVPCAAHVRGLPDVTRSMWLDRMLVARIQSKTEALATLLAETHGNWEEVFYRNLAATYGFKINTAPFTRLARLLPLKYLYKHLDFPVQIEALFFGCAGMLNRVFTDDYPVLLQKEYAHLSTKYTLDAIDGRAWKWGRLRPANFPSIRIAQFASLMSRFRGLFKAVVESANVYTLRSLFMAPVNSYWRSHSDFDRPMRPVSRKIGSQSVNGILINTAVPFLFLYGKHRGEERFVDTAMGLICSLPSETNAMTKKWGEIGMPNHHAGHSQGLLHLKREYCDLRRCVACAIGNHVLTSTQNA